MKTLFCISVSFLLFSLSCYSQHTDEVTNVSRITFFNPGLSYEKAIGRSQSLYAQAFLSTSIFIGYSSSLGNLSGIHFDPALALHYRYYYNYSAREAKGKRTDMNSLNYLALVEEVTFTKDRISSAYFDEESRRPLNSIGLVWGMQRNYRSRFSFGLALGFGYAFGKSTGLDETGQVITKTAGSFNTLGDISLGFWLNREK